ncbi:MAG: hypothetical protein R2862_13505 [Thermoanaerobaculia bacterium]
MSTDLDLEQDDDAWVNDDLDVAHVDGAVSLTIHTGGAAPAEATLARIRALLADVRPAVLLAARSIGESAYDRAHFAELGVDEDDLPDETPESIAAALQLESITCDEAGPDDFELSFAVSWDDDHSYDVAFRDGNPVTVAVNG